MNPLSSDARESVLSVLETLGEGGHEAALIERFYVCFFANNPDVVPLFGEYALAEREEMIRETLKSLLAHCEREPWLETNLRALGKSHAEYGVEAEMYPAYVSSFLATLREILGDRLSLTAEKHLGESLDEICAVMSAAGETPA